MNHHAPPGGWQPQDPGPAWMKELRAIDEHISRQVDVYIRRSKHEHKIGFLIWMTGGLTGYWIGFATVLFVQWWAGLK